MANPVIEDMVLYLEMNSTKEQKSNQQCVGSIETIPSIAWFFERFEQYKPLYTVGVSQSKG